MAVCLNHPDRDAVVRCAACGKPICSECVIDSRYCSSACRSAGIKGAVRANSVTAERKRSAKRKAIKKIFWFLFIAALAAGAGYYYMQNKKSIDKKISSTLNETKKNVDRKTNELFKERPINDSKYKEERENAVK